MSCVFTSCRNTEKQRVSFRSEKNDEVANPGNTIFFWRSSGDQKNTLLFYYLYKLWDTILFPRQLQTVSIANLDEQSTSRNLQVNRPAIKGWQSEEWFVRCDSLLPCWPPSLHAYWPLNERQCLLLHNVENGLASLTKSTQCLIFIIQKRLAIFVSYPKWKLIALGKVATQKPLYWERKPKETWSAYLESQRYPSNLKHPTLPRPDPHVCMKEPFLEDSNSSHHRTPNS